MDNAINITSEEELLGLKNEGKISENEYSELLSAMRKSPAEATGADESSDEDTHKHQCGKIAFYLLLAGAVLPMLAFLVSFAISGGGEGDAIFSICLILCVLLELPAFVCGVISWPDVYGKITVITIAAVVVLVMLYIVLYPFLAVPEQNLQTL